MLNGNGHDTTPLMKCSPLDVRRLWLLDDGNRRKSFLRDSEILPQRWDIRLCRRCALLENSSLVCKPGPSGEIEWVIPHPETPWSSPHPLSQLQSKF